MTVFQHVTRAPKDTQVETVSCKFWASVVLSCVKKYNAEGRTEVHGYSRDAWLAHFIFRETWIKRNYSSWLVTWSFCVTREEPELLTDIRDFTQ